jgi:dephospho-CoA kinase
MSTPDSPGSPTPLLVGVVGGVGSGKSAVAHWVVAHDPSIRLFDADAAGHRALTDPEIQARLRSAFGDSVVRNGVVERAEIARLVFGTSDEAVANRERLNAIVHPAIEAERERMIAEWGREGTVSAVLIDAALLVEAGWKNRCDAVVFIDTPREIRAQRVAARGWPAEELERREASQWPLARKQAEADFTVRNDGALDFAGRQMYQYIQQILQTRP